MKLTVGPLPPAVYWRRRAIVLGGLLLIILLIVYSCGSNPSNGGGSRGAHASPDASSPIAPAPSTSSLPSGPSVSASAPATPTTRPTASTAPPTAAPSPKPSILGANCGDSEVLVTTSIVPTSPGAGKLQYGGTFILKLQIQNTSSRTCTRDVGSVTEELMIRQGSTKIWSSDDCSSGGPKPHDVRTFHPGDAVSATIQWSSYDITTNGCKASSTPAPPGSYDLIGRVGTKTSSPKAFEIQR
ncbi:MAG TPA: hypothetical protein VIR00_16485 [Micromonosporaceae bacterium]